MKYSDLAEALSRIDSVLDKYKEQIPAELYDSIEKETNKLRTLAIDTFRAQVAEECAQEALEYIKNYKNEAD